MKRLEEQNGQLESLLISSKGEVGMGSSPQNAENADPATGWTVEANPRLDLPGAGTDEARGVSKHAKRGGNPDGQAGSLERVAGVKGA